MTGDPIPDDSEEDEISFLYLLLKCGLEMFKDDDDGYVSLSMRYYSKNFQESCNRFGNSVVHPLVTYIETYLTHLQIDMGEDEQAKIKITIGDNYEIGGNMSIDNSQSKSQIHSQEYREINTNGGRYVETRDNSQYIENKNESQNCIDAVAEIKKILEQLDQSYPSKTDTEKNQIATEAIKRIQNDSQSKNKIMSALQAGGISALKSALESSLNHPAVSFLITALEDFKNNK